VGILAWNSFPNTRYDTTRYNRTLFSALLARHSFKETNRGRDRNGAKRSLFANASRRRAVAADGLACGIKNSSLISFHSVYDEP